MFIRAYLRASTEDQFADRAKEMLEQFVQERGHKIASYYRENISGTKLDRPELGRLLMDSHRNDILLVEQIEQHECGLSFLMCPYHGNLCQALYKGSVWI